MKNKIILGLLVLTIFSLLRAHIVFATDYNYLPNDVYIKQQEEKSALEYRLQKLEAGISGSSSSQISSISARISQLESERTTEKNYISGTYAQYGIANQLPAKLAEIDSKYDAQINTLKAERTSLENNNSNQQSNQAEIADLKLKILQLQKELDAYYDMQRDSVLQQYQQTTFGDFFDWLESLPHDEEVAQFNLLKAMNPENAYKIELLYRAKYPAYFSKQPQGKFSLETIPEVKPVITNNQKTEGKKTEVKPSIIEEKVIPEVQSEIQIEPILEQKPASTPEPIKITFWQKVKKVFSWFWN